MTIVLKNKNRGIFFKFIIIASLLFIHAQMCNVLFAQQSASISNLMIVANDLFTQGNNKKADSIYNALHNSLIVIGNKQELAKLYQSYAIHQENGALQIIAKEYLNLTESLNNEHKALANILNAELLFPTENELVKKHLESSLFYLKDCSEISKIKILIIYGGLGQIVFQNIIAYRSLLDALVTANSIQNKHWILSSRLALIKYYKFAKLPEKAFEEIEQSIQLVTESAPIDSIGLMKILQNKLELECSEKKEMQINSTFNAICKFSLLHNNETMLNNSMLLFRTYCIDNADFDKMKTMLQQYPNEMHRLSLLDNLTYHRTMAFYQEAIGHVDSAKYLLQESETKLLTVNKGDYLMAYFYLVFGKFYLRQHDYLNAIEKLQQSLVFANQVKMPDWILDANSKISYCYGMLNKKELGYNYAIMVNNFKDSMEGRVKSEQILKLQIENENKIRLINEKNEAISKEKKFSLQYTSIVLMLLILLLVLLLLSSFNLPSWLIRAVGYIFFIFFFEFIVLLVDNKLHHFFHGEPLPIIGFKIVLISILLPFHHWIEHKIVQYLRDKKLLNPARIQEFFLDIFARVKKFINELKKEETAQH